MIKPMRPKFLILNALILVSCADVPRPALQILERDVEFEQLGEFVNDWHLSRDSIPNLGYDRSVWVKFPVINRESGERDFVLEIGAPWVDRFDFYLVGKSNFRHLEAGLLRPAGGLIYHRHPSFHFSLPAGETAVIFIRARTTGLLTLPMRLWSADDFQHKIPAEYSIHGIYFGTIAALLIYNLSVFFFVRDRSYLLYCAYLTCIFIVYAIMGGFAKQFLPGEDRSYFKPLMLFTGLLSMVFVSLFTRDFLILREINRKLDKGIMGLSIFCLTRALIIPLIPYSAGVRIVNLIIPILTISLISTAAWCANRGVSQSRYFLLAWIVLAAGTLMEFATKFGVIPVTTPGRFGTQIGSLFEVLLFSVSLGRRIRSLSEEKASAQSRLRSLENDLEIARRIHARILTAQMPILQNASVRVSYLPLHAVGGDFYDFHETDGSQTGILIADVTGHGVGAALDSSTVKIAFRQEIMEMTSPAALLKNMNHFLKDLLEYRFVSALYLYLDLGAMKASVASGGHPPMLLVRDGVITPVETEGSLLAVFPDPLFEVKSFNLAARDRLLLFTDGLFEMLTDEEDSMQVFYRIIQEINTLPADLFHRTLLEKLARRRKETFDDITLLTVDIGSR